jgi:hypothetical protein
MKSLKIIASYLPQFHPIPENDIWHGKGFTEWFNVGKAKPLFKDHDQPRVPTELGYYDLRVDEVREQQAKLASDYGIHGFCYWHYWFGNGKQLLEKPLERFLTSHSPNFPFCLAWANETWQGIDHGIKSRILIKQEYPGVDDYKDHFYKMLNAFKDNRYIRHNNKLIFMLYKPFDLPNFIEFKNLWNELAIENNLPGFLFIAQINDYKNYDKAINIGYDMVNIVRIRDIERVKFGNIYSKIRWRIGLKRVYNYKDAINHLQGIEDSYENVAPTIVPNWDHSPRSGKNGLIYHDSTPALFEVHLNKIFDIIKEKNEDDQIVFIKSWNEWGEGNYLEPDIKYGRKYLEVLIKVISKFKFRIS